MYHGLRPALRRSTCPPILMALLIARISYRGMSQRSLKNDVVNNMTHLRSLDTLRVEPIHVVHNLPRLIDKYTRR